MRFARLVAVATLVSGLLAPGVARATDPSSFSIMHQNQQLHIAASYGIALTLTETLKATGMSRLESVLMASIVTMGIGAIKERYLDDHWSPGDMIANGIGTGFSAACVLTFSL